MFEYLAAGMPILATRIEAHTSIFKDSDFVFWAMEDAASMACAIKAIDDCKIMLPALGKRARDCSKMWDWSESAKRLSHAIEPIALKVTPG
jgi:glycosyltransferase involved in cell wall biosynthesis